MADSNARARSTAAARERARDRQRESDEQTASETTVVATAAVAAEAIPAEPATDSPRQDELTRIEEAMAAEIASRTADRLPVFEAPTVELPDEFALGQEDTTETPAGQTVASTDPISGAHSEQQAADLLRDRFETSQASGTTTNPEASQAVDTFNDVSAALRGGQRPDVGGGADMDVVLRPGIGRAERGDGPPSQSSLTSGGVVSDAKTDLDLGMTLASAAVGVASGPVGTALGVSYGVTRYIDETTGAGDALVDYALGERIEPEGVFGEAESAPASTNTTPSSPGVPNPDASLLGDDPVHTPAPSRAEEETKARAAEARRQAAEEAAKAKAEAEAAAEAAAKEAEAAAEEAAAEEARASGANPGQPPDDHYIDPEEAIALRDYLNRMTGYAAAKSIPGDIDPNEHDTGEPTGGTGNTSNYENLKGDDRHVEGSTGGAITGDLGSAGNTDGNIDPTDEAGSANFADGLDQDMPDLSGPGQTMVNPFEEDDSGDSPRWSPGGSDQPLFSYSRETSSVRDGYDDDDSIEG